MTTKRRPLDRYDTAPWQVRALLAHVPEIKGTIVEPCSGDDSITRVLIAERPECRVFTNDIDPNTPAELHLDATGRAFWEQVSPFDWVVSNTPYKMPDCLEIAKHAVEHAKVGVALMLRLTFAEPTDTRHPRGPWLEGNPYQRQLVLPRYSFSGDGNSDSVTTAWFLWAKKGRLSGKPFLSLYHADVVYASIPEIVEGARNGDSE